MLEKLFFYLYGFLRYASYNVFLLGSTVLGDLGPGMQQFINTNNPKECMRFES